LVIRDHMSSSFVNFYLDSSVHFFKQRSAFLHPRYRYMRIRVARPNKNRRSAEVARIVRAVYPVTSQSPVKATTPPYFLALRATNSRVKQAPCEKPRK